MCIRDSNSPYAYVMDKGYEELPDMNIHRTFFAKNFRHFLRGLHAIYSSHGSIADFAVSESVPQSEFPAWKLVESLNRELYNANGCDDSRCLPGNLDATALKRVNMALRWLVRNDGIVDLEMCIRDRLLSVEDPRAASIKRLKEHYERLRREEENPSVYRVNLQVEANPNGEMVLVLDPEGGDQMKARGNGNLRIEYNSTNDDTVSYTHLVRDAR